MCVGGWKAGVPCQPLDLPLCGLKIYISYTYTTSTKAPDLQVEFKTQNRKLSSFNQRSFHAHQPKNKSWTTLGTVFSNFNERYSKSTNSFFPFRMIKTRFYYITLLTKGNLWYQEPGSYTPISSRILIEYTRILRKRRHWQTQERLWMKLTVHP